ncbi:hypothetical protein QYE76_057569 [Lolium multiflorum]|uniref:Protein kinase domain-containing protein n=1 Tax=Lolium multiflorum TaxID=4521 RepID=A0AAD8T4P2_LOLMU|nr:hypothetical protein QYE76_057569 [Lolium multiflorum]
MARGCGMVGKNPTKTLAATLLLLLLAVSPLCTRPAASQPLHSEPMSTEPAAASPPPPPPQSPQPKIPHAQPGGAARLRRIALGVLFGSLAGFLLSLAFLYAIRAAVLHARDAPAVARGPVSFTPQISPKSLQLALPSARPLALGTYHKLVLDGDLTVAVKRLDTAFAHPDSSPLPPLSKADMRRVQRQLEQLARVRHLNVMSLKAYVREPDRLSLVYDFVPGGSLEDVMKRVRSQQLSLDWDTRNRIAAGIAKGLRYLHFECSPRILHCNLKPSNVMLEEGFEPVLAGCGVARLFDSGLAADPESSGSLYTAPECYQSSRYTDKCDVYGFGLILGVLLTGRDPTDPFFSGESGRGGLARWLRHMQHSGEAKEALDSSITGEEVDEEEMLMAVRVAIMCLSDAPADRPSSDELAAMLTQLHSF